MADTSTRQRHWRICDDSGAQHRAATGCRPLAPDWSTPAPFRSIGQSAENGA
jgi:hypothetical protein